MTPTRVATTLFGIISFLVLMTILFEMGKDQMIEQASSKMRPVISALFSEMTVLGFLSLITFGVSKASLLQEMSAAIFGESEEREGYLEELLERIHYVLFAVMCLFIFQVIALVHHGNIMEERWIALNK